MVYILSAEHPRGYIFFWTRTFKPSFGGETWKSSKHDLQGFYLAETVRQIPANDLLPIQVMLESSVYKLAQNLTQPHSTILPTH